MCIKRSVLALSGALAIAASAAGQKTAAASDLSADVQQQLTALTETYRHLHRNPELSRREEKTSAFLAEELRKLGYSVTEHVGRYTDGSQADGVVAVMEDGSGPRLLIRTDMDHFRSRRRPASTTHRHFDQLMSRARRSASCTPAGMTCT